VGISDAYHLTRIRLLAKRAGWEDFGVIPADERPQGFSEVRSIIREVFAVVYYGLHLDAFIELPSAVPMAWNPLPRRINPTWLADPFEQYSLKTFLIPAKLST
jgi:hypothetical protein